VRPQSERSSEVDRLPAQIETDASPSPSTALQSTDLPDYRAIGAAGVLHLVFFGLLLPWAAVRSNRKLAAAGQYPPRKKFFVSTLLQQIVCVVVSIVVARREWIDVFAPKALSAGDSALGVLALAMLVAAMAKLWKRNVERRLPKVELFGPRDALERTLWIGISIAAGVGEEITYRGVMFTLLFRLTGETYLATLVAAVVFAASHLLQGWKSALVIFFFALVFQGLVLATGTLYVAMAVHCAYDVTAGMVYGSLCKKRDAASAGLAPQ
jgi:membrane protease YdiL (CAAX protease family)